MTADPTARRARWMGGALALTVACAACAISFPDYTLGAGGSASTTSGSTTSASTTSASTTSGSTTSGSTTSASSTSSSSGGTCDGGVGSYMAGLPFTARAFDVAADGATVAVTVTVDTAMMGSVQAVCLHPDGTTARAPFTVAGSSFDALEYSMSDVDVARAATGEIAVSWNYHDPNQNADNKVAFLAADCSDLTAGTDLEASALNIKRPAVVRASAKHFFFLYDAHSIGQIRLVSYSLTGSFLGAVMVGPGCAAGGYGRALGVGEAGSAVVGCQSTTGKRYFQRFSSNLIPLDNVPQAVPELDVITDASTVNLGGYLIEGSAGGVAFVAEPVSGSVSWPAVLIGTNNVKTTADIPGGAALSNDRILSAPSGAFLLPVQAGPDTFEELSPSGLGQSWPLDGTIFRVDACNALYAVAGVTLSKSAAPW